VISCKSTREINEGPCIPFDKWRDDRQCFAERTSRVRVSFCLRKRPALRCQSSRQIGQGCIRVGMGEASLDIDCLLACSQCLLVTAEVGQAETKGAEANHQIGQEGVRARLGETPSDVDGL